MTAYLTVTLTVVGQPLAITSVALVIWSRVGSSAPDVSGQRGLGRRVDGALLDHVVVADRVAVALQPDVLAGVGVQVLHPQLGRVRVRGVGADRLDVHPTEPARLRDDDGDGRVALERILVGEGVVRPRDADRRVTRGDVRGLGDDRHEVAGIVELLEEVEARRRVVERAARGDARRPDARDGLVRHGRIAGEGDLALVLGLEQVVPVLRHVRRPWRCSPRRRARRSSRRTRSRRHPWPWPGCESQVATL